METYAPNRKAAVITGASSGIGREVALQAARKGYAIIAVARRRDRLDALCAEIQRFGGACVPVTLDVTQSGAAERIVDAARTRFGRIDVLFNGAGYASAGALLEQSDALIDQQWNLHVGAPLRLTRAALPLLRECKGQVLFVGSGLARTPAPYYGAYCAAKAAVRAAATQLRRELRGSGVAVTYIDPGAVVSEFSEVSGLQPYAGRAPVERVAAAIVRGFDKRPATLNAVPFHGFTAMMGDLFPTLADVFVFANIKPPAGVGAIPVPAPHPQPAPSPQPQPQPQLKEEPQTDFDRALEPVSRRMERVKLPPSFLAELLRLGQDVQLSDAAMRWAGMPNKNERAALAEALDALTAGGFLQRTGEESWRVVRSAQ